MANNNKHTGPNVPALRFPEFSGEWTKIKLGDLGSFFSGGTPSSSRKDFYGGEIPFIRSGELHSDSTALSITKEAYDSCSAKMVNKGDLLLALYGATSGDISISRISGAINQAILCIRPQYMDAYFIKSLWEKHKKHILETYLQGGQGNLSSEIIKNISFFFPNSDEQVKISRLIHIIDDRIETQSKIIEELTTLRSALHQAIMSTGLEDGSWRMQTLDEVLSERTELNNEGHAVHSVSVSKGIVNQIEYLGRSFAAKDTSRYHVAYPGDVIYTKSPTGEFPYGIVKQSQIPIKAALSPLYGVYIPITPEIGYVIHNHFLSAKNALNYLHPLIQKGAKNTINITNQRFLQNSMPLPTNKIAALLYNNAIKTVSDKIILEEMVMEKLQSQKSFLLKTMFI